MRLYSGVFGAAMGIAFVAALILTHSPGWLRLVAFLPFYFGAAGFWQYREKT